MTHSFPARRSSDLDASCATRPVREWLADQARVPAQLPGTTKGFPGVSRTDPAAAWSARTVRGRFGYALNVLIDTPSGAALDRSEEHTSELQSLMRISYAVFCLKKKKNSSIK